MRAISSWKADQGCSSEKDDRNVTPSWHKFVYFFWGGHPPYSLEYWWICQERPEGCHLPRRVLLQTPQSCRWGALSSQLEPRGREVLVPCVVSWNKDSAKKIMFHLIMFSSISSMLSFDYDVREKSKNGKEQLRFVGSVSWWMMSDISVQLRVFPQTQMFWSKRPWRALWKRNHAW